VPSAEQTTAPPVGATHGVQLVPQELTEALGTHWSPHRWKSSSQVTPQPSSSQMAVPCPGSGQVAQDSPQAETSSSAAHRAPQAWNPDAQVKPQASVVQMALPLATAGQGVHRAPQVATTSSEAQAGPQAWKSSSQLRPQVDATQVGEPLAGSLHSFVHDPQCSGSLVESTHSSPHSVGVGAAHLLEHWRLDPCAVHSGVAPVQAVVQLPQCAAVVVSVSQPLVALPSQFALPSTQTSTQAPATQLTAAGFTPGSAVQSLPHAPQFLTLV